MKKARHLSKLFILLCLTLILTVPVTDTQRSASNGPTFQLTGLLDDVSIIK